MPTPILLALLTLPAAQAETPSVADAATLTSDDVDAALRAIELDFTPEEVEQMLGTVQRRVRQYERLRARSISNDVVPATTTPWAAWLVPRAGQERTPAPTRLPKVARPEDLDDACSWSIVELAALLRTTDVTCVELTEAYLDRLERLDARLHCVVTFTRERALAQAAERDAELARGVDRGWLHGLPWGVKDLMAVEGHPTTWGARPFADQSIDATAEVVRRLDEAGAILIAKLSVGALAMGDVWFRERTRSPWDTSRGSSGSSAGSAAATAAGGVAFSLGTETLGSIVSPSVACATSALRPTLGRVPRTGTMALSWTMDKVGPIARTVQDASLVFDAIRGADAGDPASRDGAVPVAGDYAGRALRIGVPDGAFQRGGGVDEIAAELEALGHEIVPIELPDFPTRAMLVILHAEAAAAFDELTRSNADDELVRQDDDAWPNTFRAARLIPAVEYVRAQRLRTLLMREMDAALADVDLVVHAPYAAGVLTATNLTGHPTVVAPFVPEDGPRPDGSPRTISFTGHLDCDEELLAAVVAWQDANPHHVRRPPLAWLGGDDEEGERRR
ncbi:MAG: amidase [Planctomycetota bacterium]